MADLRFCAYQYQNLPQDWKTGRGAQTGDLETHVRDHRLAAFLTAMRADLKSHPTAWENSTLDRYLEALAALTDETDAMLANRGEHMPTRPDWRLVAELLVVATGYK